MYDVASHDILSNSLIKSYCPLYSFSSGSMAVRAARRSMGLFTSMALSKFPMIFRPSRPENIAGI